MNIQKDKIKKILIVRRNNIGDMICAFPVFRTLREEFPDAHITVLAEKSIAGIIEGASYIDDVIIYRRGRGLFRNKYLGYYNFFRQNRNRFDFAVAVKVGFSSLLAFITVLSGAKIRMGCISEKWHPLQLCYNVPINNFRRWKSIHEIDSLLEFIKTIGVKQVVKDISIEIAPEYRNKVNSFIKKNKILTDNNIVIFNISNNRIVNTWSLERFKETADVLSKHYKIAYIITSIASDKDKALRLSKDINALCFETPSVMDFAALVAEADLLICGEGGSMHIGAGVHTPTISLWGKFRPDKWTPFGEKQFIIKRDKHVDSISANDILEVIKENGLLK